MLYRARIFEKSNFNLLVKYYLQESGYSQNDIEKMLNEWTDEQKILSLLPEIYSDYDYKQTPELIKAQKKWKKNIKFKGWNKKDSGAPPADFIGNGRANPDHIRYLYLSEDAVTPVYEHSWSGRIDTNICNTFIMEAEQQLVNAIELFELGYFDCAYYSLRSAVDISTTMVFLSDMPDEDREKNLSAWKATEDFPMQGQMIKQLSRQGNIFADMVNKMPVFFTSAKALSAELNKYVHKQGLQHFYISRNHPINQQNPLDGFIKAFEAHLQRCIGVVAVMRLAIDPFPILLMDEEILYRCFDSMTEPYSKEFVEKYIGETIISEYKNTDIYIGTYDSFANDEKKNKAVFDVMKHQYIDSKKIDEIISQLHLLSKDDIICVLIVAASKKIVKIYCHNGLAMYFTDRNTSRTIMSWSGADFKAFAEAEERINQPYDEAYISVFTIADKEFYVEHNEKLNADDIDEIIRFVTGALAKTSKGHD